MVSDAISKGDISALNYFVSEKYVKAIDALARQGVRGFRIYPGAAGVAGWLDTPGMQAIWRCASEDGLALCPLIGSDALPGLARQCEKFPQARVVIDHFARIGVSGEFRAADVDALGALARFPHVRVKASAYYAFGQKRAPYLDFAPLIRQLRDAFGAARLMWGSDWPVLGLAADHARWCDVTDELLALDGSGGAAWIRGGVAGWLAQRNSAPAAPASAVKPAPSPTASKPAPSPAGAKGRSPSTVRRQLGQAERDLATATERRDAIALELQSAVDHREMGAIGERLATAQAAVDALEETWLALADEAEALGLEL